MFLSVWLSVSLCLYMNVHMKCVHVNVCESVHVYMCGRLCVYVHVSAYMCMNI